MNTYGTVSRIVSIKIVNEAISDEVAIRAVAEVVIDDRPVSITSEAIMLTTEEFDNDDAYVSDCEVEVFSGLVRPLNRLGFSDEEIASHFDEKEIHS